MIKNELLNLNKGKIYMFENRFVRKVKKIYKKEGYENIPYVSQKNAKWIIKHLNDGCFMMAIKEYMKTMKVKGKIILRGHIVLLWWLNNPRTKKNKFPLYFEREYGIDAEKALYKLKRYSWVDKENKLTVKGKEILSEYDYIINQHRAIKSILSDGTVEYNYTPILKGEAKKEERLRCTIKALKYHIDYARKSKLLLQWRPAHDDKICPKCRELAERDNGYGKGIYTPEQAEKILNEIHWDCRCTFLPVVEYPYE